MSPARVDLARAQLSAAIFPVNGVCNEETAMDLKGTKTHDNLKAAFAG